MEQNLYITKFAKNKILTQRITTLNSKSTEINHPKECHYDPCRLRQVIIIFVTTASLFVFVFFFPLFLLSTLIPYCSPVMENRKSFV
jgi:hypothetical protein